ncbi:radical SAM family heme chaperone HemW [Bacillus solitudinis]|uniref:radical SAM family heme chaperone HemW n=1 Tax=Bacillus solitudinis TaxID=2014074 RepID=UPI0018E29136|nr:radical SAM family heme chaperone HemW [Bacillus solitudinis]
MITAAYVHIPFCEHICHYCDFNKVFLKNQPVDDYIQSLLTEMKLTMNQTPTKKLTSIYVGGGTPTALSAKQLEQLLKGMNEILPVKEIEEYTVEVNPDSCDESKLIVLKEAGVNRLSMGVQSFDQHLLEGIGRTHSKESIKMAIEKCREIGFSNISIDLMFGLPQQSPSQFSATLEQAIALEIEHISAYSLKVEEKTVFYNRLRKGQLPLPTEDDEVMMYEMLQSELMKADFHQYEISNFGKRGYASKHNLVYWNNQEYYGFGAGAHGYVNGVRTQNHGPVSKYIKAINEGKLPYLIEHQVTRVEQLEEAMFMGLRKTEGISKTDFNRRYGFSVEELYSTQLENLFERGLLEDKHDFLRLTSEGILLGNEVFEKFLAVLEKERIQRV